MKILVSGVAGLIGSHLAEQLIKKGHTVYGVDNLSIGLKSNIPSKVKFYKLDLLNTKAVNKMMSEVKPDIVHHTACFAYEGLSQFSPKLVTENTYNIALNMMIASIKYKVKRFVQYSSMSVYGDQKPPFDEKLGRRPVDIYAVAKTAAELAIEILSKVFDIEYTILRPHNLIGERQLIDPYRNVAMIFMNRIMQGKPPIVYGDGEQKRSFSYVGDAIPAMIRAGESKETNGEIINVGPVEEFSINYLAEVILKEFGREDLTPIHMPDRPQEVKNAWCTNDKAQRLLGFKTTTTFEEAIHKMAVWAKKQGPRKFKYFHNLELENDKTPRTWKEKLM